MTEQPNYELLKKLVDGEAAPEIRTSSADNATSVSAKGNVESADEINAPINSEEQENKKARNWALPFIPSCLMILTYFFAIMNPWGLYYLYHQPDFFLNSFVKANYFELNTGCMFGSLIAGISCLLMLFRKSVPLNAKGIIAFFVVPVVLWQLFMFLLLYVLHWGIPA
jgi:hypothetical protein